MFPSILQNPQDLYFAGQDPDEKIVLAVRAHPITNLSWILLALAIFLIPFVLPVIDSGLKLNFLVHLSDLQILALLVVDYLLVLIIVFEGFLYWYFNIGILTNERVIDVQFDNLLSSGQDIAMLDDIQEATPTRTGLLGLIFDLGDVEIQTAGAKVGIKLMKIPQPFNIADIILEQAEKWKGQE